MDNETAAARATRKSPGALAATALAVAIIGLLLPERLSIPVQGAATKDWNSSSFWHRPWGRSGVHRGIDIFAAKGTPVLSSCSGIVVSSGTSEGGGNSISILGPRWRIHYYAHLSSLEVKGGDFVLRGGRIGTVGTTGNAAGKPPHLHYAIITQIPYFWRFKLERFGFDRMFFLDPDRILRGQTNRKG